MLGAYLKLSNHQKFEVKIGVNSFFITIKDSALPQIFGEFIFSREKSGPVDVKFKVYLAMY